MPRPDQGSTGIGACEYVAMIAVSLAIVIAIGVFVGCL